MPALRPNAKDDLSLSSRQDGKNCAEKGHNSCDFNGDVINDKIDHRKTIENRRSQFHINEVRSAKSPEDSSRNKGDRNEWKTTECIGELHASNAFILSQQADPYININDNNIDGIDKDRETNEREECSQSNIKDKFEEFLTVLESDRVDFVRDISDKRKVWIYEGTPGRSNDDDFGGTFCDRNEFKYIVEYNVNGENDSGLKIDTRWVVHSGSQDVSVELYRKRLNSEDQSEGCCEGTVIEEEVITRKRRSNTKIIYEECEEIVYEKIVYPESIGEFGESVAKDMVIKELEEVVRDRGIVESVAAWKGDNQGECLLESKKPEMKVDEVFYSEKCHPYDSICDVGGWCEEKIRGYYINETCNHLEDVGRIPYKVDELMGEAQLCDLNQVTDVGAEETCHISVGTASFEQQHCDAVLSNILERDISGVPLEVIEVNEKEYTNSEVCLDFVDSAMTTPVDIFQTTCSTSEIRSQAETLVYNNRNDIRSTVNSADFTTAQESNQTMTSTDATVYGNTNHDIGDPNNIDEPYDIGDPDHDINTGGDNEPGLPLQQGQQAPIIQMKGGDFRFKVGEGIRIAFNITGIPTPQVTWYKNGNPIDADDRLALCISGDEYSLVIRNSLVRDSGGYSVGAVNIEGSVQTDDINVTVESRFIRNKSNMPGFSKDDEANQLRTAVANYTPVPGTTHSLSLVEGQSVVVTEMIRRPHLSLVQTIPPSVKEGWVPSCYVTSKPNTSVIQRSSKESFREDIIQISNKQQEALVKRRYLVTELIETEREYVAGIEQTLKTFSTLMYTTSTDIPHAMRDKRSIFRNIDSIARFHTDHFLSDLLNCACNPSTLPQTFLKWAEEFARYVDFGRGEDEAFEIFRDAHCASFIQDFCSSVSRSVSCFEEGLNKPLARLNEYHAFLQAFLRYTIHTNEDRAATEAAILMIADILHRIEDGALLTQIIGYHGDVLNMGAIVRHGDLDIACENQGRQYHVFMFPGRLLLTSWNKDENHYVFEQEILIHEKLVGIPHDSASLNFELWPRDGAINTPVISFTSQNSRSLDAWLLAIRSDLISSGFELTDIMPEIRAPHSVTFTSGTDEYVSLDEAHRKAEKGTTLPVFKQRLCQVTAKG